eukprot:m.146135 g.146135  ORF g.146135 m.146135 type:complete len:527 (+) comp17241_c0_seq1:275-1855(+)
MAERYGLLGEDDHDGGKYQHIKSGVVDVPDDGHTHFSWRKLWAFTGPGFLMSIAYLDPGNIESDLQAGAQTGYKLLWILFWSTIMGLFLQLLSARLGVVTGHNMAQLCRTHYSPPVRIALWLMMELAIIGSDIQEVIGSAIAIYILSAGAVPLWAGSLITAVDTFTFLFLESYGLRKLEALFAVLITTMSITFGYMYIRAAPSQLEVIKGTAIPEASTDDIDQAIGIVGAVIMPHNLYLHSALVTSRSINPKDRRAVREANFYYLIETSVALLISFVINLFVVSVFAYAFYGQTIIDGGKIINPEDIDLLISGDVLGIKFGTAVKYIWALGLLAAGQSSTMTGTYAGQFVMEGFLKLKIKPWKRVALTRTVAMAPTVTVALLASPSILNTMNEWLNVLQSIQLPFALIPVMHLTSIVGLMGPFVNGMWTKLLGWAMSLGIIGVNIYLIWDTINGIDKTYMIIAGVLALVYLAFVFYLFLGPFLKVGSQAHFYENQSYATADDDAYDQEVAQELHLQAEPLLGHAVD